MCLSCVDRPETGDGGGALKDYSGACKLLLSAFDRCKMVRVQLSQVREGSGAVALIGRINRWCVLLAVAGSGCA